MGVVFGAASRCVYTFPIRDRREIRWMLSGIWRARTKAPLNVQADTKLALPDSGLGRNNLQEINLVSGRNEPRNSRRIISRCRQTMRY